MKQLRANSHTYNNSIDYPPIEDEFDQESCNNLSPSHNNTIGPWKPTCHQLNKIYSKKQVSPKKENTRPSTVSKYFPLLLKKMENKTDQCIQAGSKIQLQFTNFMINADITTDSKEKYLPLIKTSLYGISKHCIKQMIPISEVLKKKIIDKHNTKLTGHPLKLLADAINKTEATKERRVKNYSMNLIIPKQSKLKKNAQLHRRKSEKENGTKSMLCTQIDTRKNSCCVYFM